MSITANPVEHFPGMPGEEPGLRKFLVYSMILHGCLAAAIVTSIVFHLAGNTWGGIGGTSGQSVNVKLVGNMGIPMPNPPVTTESQAVDPTKGLYQPPPQPTPPAPPKDATPLPTFEKEK